MKKDFRLKFSLLITLVMIIVFMGFRFALWRLNLPFFQVLSSSELISCFLNGFRFDFSIISLFLLPLILLLNLPIKWTRWVKFWINLILLESVFITGFLVGDLIYFPKVNRHISEEIVQVSSDIGFLVKYIVFQEWLPLAILLGVLFVLAWKLNKYISKNYLCRKWGYKKEILLAVCIILVVALGIRGHFGRGKSLGVADVYNYVNNSAGAALTLNGAFTAYQVGRKGSIQINNPFPTDKAIELSQQLIIGQKDTLEFPNYPLMRKTAIKTDGKKKNIVVVLLEGWHPYYVDALSNNNFGVTPVFDKIVKEGINFSNAYATGLRSIFGFAAVFSSTPLIPGLPLFGYGLELSALNPTLKHFSDAGYYTLFAQTSHRDSYRMCALAEYLGAQGSYGWEDIPERASYNEKAPFGYDYDMFMFVADKIKERKKDNFTAFVFTGITHEPFVSTLSQFDKYPYDSWEHGFLNTLGFSDWSIGQFLERSKQDGWFDDTIFVFVADHTSGGPSDSSLKNHFRIPLVVYAPKVLKAQQLDYVVSQLDIVPTLYSLAGITPEYTAFGKDLFDVSTPHVALISEGVNVGLITQDGEMRHSGEQILTVEKYASNFDEKNTEEKLLSLDKAAYTLLKNNNWYLENK